MNLKARMMTGLVSATMVAACSPSPAPETSEISQSAQDAYSAAPEVALPPPMPTQTAHVPAAVPGSMVVYACVDGSGLTVTYDKYSALVKLPSGSTMLSRAETASNSGNDAYLGEELSLYRNGDLVELLAEGKSRTCTKHPGNS